MKTRVRLVSQCVGDLVVLAVCISCQSCGDANSRAREATTSDSAISVERQRIYALRPELTDPNAPFALAVSHDRQLRLNWCWAASGSMIMNFERRAGPQIIQCDQANTRWPGRNCCADRTCNWTGYPDFRAFGFTSQCRKQPLRFDDLRNELQAQHPIAFSWRYSDQSEHMMVIYGYAVTATRRWLYIHDPLYRVTYTTYEAYSGSRGGPGHGRDYYRIIDAGAPPAPTGYAPPDQCVENVSLKMQRDSIDIGGASPRATPSHLNELGIEMRGQGSDSGRHDAANALALDLLKLEEETRESAISTQQLDLLVPVEVTRLETEDTLSSEVFYIRLDSLARYRPGTSSIRRMLEPTSERSQAILNQAVAIATGSIIRGKGGAWGPGSLGPPNVARAIVTARRQLSDRAKKGEKIEIIVVRTPPPFGAEFAGWWADGNLWLIPASTTESFSWVPGRAILADSVFAELSPHARRIQESPADHQSPTY